MCLTNLRGTEEISGGEAVENGIPLPQENKLSKEQGEIMVYWKRFL